MNSRLALLLEERATAWAVLVVSVGMTILAWFASERYIDRDAHQRFDAMVELSRHGILERITAYHEVLRAGAGLITGSEHVTRTEWKTFVESLEIDRIHPGIQGLGYAVRLPAGGKGALEASVRDEGFADFAVWPVGDADPYTVVLYLEPFDARNRRAFGFDLSSEPVRREAIVLARDQGRITMSGRVTLTEDTDQEVKSGALLFLPIYRPGMPRTNVREHEAALASYVFCTFRIADLMRHILGHGLETLEMSLYDGSSVAEAALMYRSNPAREESRQPRYTSVVTMDVGGRSWTARFTSSTAFESEISSIQPALIAIGGLAADLLLFLALLAVSRNGRRAALERNRFRMAVEAAPVAMIVASEDGTIDLVNPTFEKLFGYERNELLGQKVETLLPVDLRERHVAMRQVYMLSPVVRQMGAGRDLFGLHKDGSRIPLEIGLSPSESDSGHFVIAAVSDITERKRLEADRAKSEEVIRHLAFHDPLTQLPNRRLLADRLKLAIAATRRSGGHGALLFVDLDKFKDLNDACGHETGDQLLVQVGQRLANCVRAEDTVARFGGDEFVVMLAALSDDAGESVSIARVVGDKILESMSQPFLLNRQQHRITASIGATLFRGEDSVDAIFRRADAAMYQVKASGRNALIFFETGR
jgi:diguanylate cyclase (GGDEF)-like protein/PAS domain S-box-containing protein